jgi:diadenosine tetraphosphate (Ap4A) HIT family hydrolase
VTETCDLCRNPGGEVLWSDDRCRVVLVADERFPGYCRVVWNDHVPEMTDLSSGDRAHLMEVTWAIESALRSALRPDKVNLASFGNMTPHLHWHVIPRWRDDSHFPQSIWSAPERRGALRSVDAAMLRGEIGCRLPVSRG